VLRADLYAFHTKIAFLLDKLWDKLLLVPDNGTRLADWNTLAAVSTGKITAVSPRNIPQGRVAAHITNFSVTRNQLDDTFRALFNAQTAAGAFVPVNFYAALFFVHCDSVDRADQRAIPIT